MDYEKLNEDSKYFHNFLHFIAGIGGTCSKDHDCDVVNSSCNVTKCACDSSTIPSADKSKCLEGKLWTGHMLHNVASLLLMCLFTIE